MNMGKMKARTSQIGEAVDRIEKLTEKMDGRKTGPQELKDLSVSIVSSAKRIQGATERMEVAVNGFKEGRFTLLQSLLDGQNLLTNQMVIQAQSFRELMKAYQVQTHIKAKVNDDAQDGVRIAEQLRPEGGNPKPVCPIPTTSDHCDHM